MKRLTKQIRIIYLFISKKVHELWAVLFPRNYAHYYYMKATGKMLNLNNPQDYHEKVQWLKVYSDISQWTTLADKYKVREYIIQCGLDSILVKLYGVWKSADEINFSALPDRFVLKPNNCFGRVIVVYDKNQLDIGQTRALLNKWVNERYGLLNFQPHYWNIERRIIAEELLEDKSINSFSDSLIDYKFYCIHGEPQIVLVLFNRKNLTVGRKGGSGSETKYACAFDLNWNMRPEILSEKYEHDLPVNLPKPKRFNEMIKISRILSSPFPQVRVDLYEVDNKIYFSELTFTTGGDMRTFKSEYYLKLGERIDLSRAPLKKGII